MENGIEHWMENWMEIWIEHQIEHWVELVEHWMNIGSKTLSYITLYNAIQNYTWVSSPMKYTEHSLCDWQKHDLVVYDPRNDEKNIH